MSVSTVDSTGKTNGYVCEELVKKNTLFSSELTFYFDLRFPAGDDADVIARERARSFILDQVAMHYDIYSGESCVEPPTDGRSWIVRVASDSSDYSHIALFDSCQVLSTSGQEVCQVTEGKIQLDQVGVLDNNDVLFFIRDLLDNLNEEDLAPYNLAFLGTAIDTGTGDAGRDNLPPAINRDITQDAPTENRKTVTIVGGLLVAAFVLAFLGIIFIICRRRQKYLVSRDIELAISKSDMHFKEGATSGSEDGGAKSVDQDGTDEDLIEMDDPETPKDEAHFPNNITFDLGNSFRNELMGVHGNSAPSSKLMPPFGLHGSADATSDSDADSWAQTDGTIGSLELQLEPITAEV